MILLFLGQKDEALKVSLQIRENRSKSCAVSRLVLQIPRLQLWLDHSQRAVTARRLPDRTMRGALLNRPPLPRRRGSGRRA